MRSFLLMLLTPCLFAAKNCPAFLALEGRLSSEARDELAFVQTMTDDFYNWDLRLVYADWLEERGTEERVAQAHAIRLAHDIETNPRRYGWLIDPRARTLRRLHRQAGWSGKHFSQRGWKVILNLGVPSTLLFRDSLVHFNGRLDWARIDRIWNNLMSIPTVTSVEHSDWMLIYTSPLQRWAVRAALEGHLGALARLRKHGSVYDAALVEAGLPSND